MAEEVCRAYRNNGSCRYGDDCKYEHSEGEPIAPPPRGECFNWKETGECNFGDRCRFTHGPDDPRLDGDGQRIPAPGAKKKKKKRKPRKPRDDGEKLDEICNNYQAGRCRYGDSCRRQHVGDVLQEPVVKIDEICNNYQEGRCRFGDNCRRQHVDA